MTGRRLSTVRTHPKRQPRHRARPANLGPQHHLLATRGEHQETGLEGDMGLFQFPTKDQVGGLPEKGNRLGPKMLSLSQKSPRSPSNGKAQQCKMIIHLLFNSQVFQVDLGLGKEGTTQFLT